MALLVRFFIVMFFIGVVFLAPAKADEAVQLHEQEIEAGLIYNFLKYIEWPANETARAAPVSVCIYGNDPFKSYLQPIAGRTVNQRRIEVSSIYELAAAAACDLLYVSAGAKDQWPQLEKFLAGKNILTVGSFDDFAGSGGMIEFGRSDNHIRVSLNIDALTAAKLHAEDRLLKLVTVVQPSGGGQ